MKRIVRGLIEKEISRLEESLTRKPTNTLCPKIWEGVERDIKQLKAELK